MKLKILFIIPGICFFFLISCQMKDSIQIVSTSVDNMQPATGIDPKGFFFSWKLQSEGRNVKQVAYDIVVSKNKNFTDRGGIWDSGKIQSSKSILVNYKGKKIEPGKTYYWKVKVWDNNGNESKWSKVNLFTTGLFSEVDWNGAKWIAYDTIPPENRLVPGIHLPGKKYRAKKLGFHKLPLIRKEFNVKEGLKQALVFVSGLGHYEMKLNGKKIGDSFIAPGWTHYDKTALYNTYDCTSQLQAGENAIGIELGNGFLIVPNSRYRKTMTAYANPMMIMCLKLVYENGKTKYIVSDGSWKTSQAPTTYSSIYGGENYDARLEQLGWDNPGFNDIEWKDAKVVDAVCENLLPEKDFPVKITEILDVENINKIESLENSWLYDFGQNASGVFEITVKGNPGDTIVLTPSELIYGDYRANQRATGRSHYYKYVLKGNGEEIWRPKFTYYGFRYIQVDGANPVGKTSDNKMPEIINLKMLHNRNSSPEVGSFQTSFELFNRIDTLVKWAIKSNFQSVLSDCPHREKLGWLEQTFLMGGSVHFNYDIYGLYLKIIDDMITAQLGNGLVPDIVPEYVAFEGGFRDSPEWGSAAVILPWLVYKWYGHLEPIKKAWPMMEKYVKYLESTADNHIVTHGLGDWFDLGPDRPGFSQLTPEGVTATSIYYYDVWLMSEMAKLLGKDPDIKKYSIWAKKIKNAFNDKFFGPETNIYSSGSQTAISMPLALGLVDEDKKEAVVQALVESIHNSDNALTAGDIGFHYLVRALSENGQGELLYKMNARDDVPGYGYQLKHGATALTESWPALEIVSNNHLMLGHIMEWFYKGLGGIGQTDASVAYSEVKIEPQVVGGLEKTKASYESPYGTIKTGWSDSEKEFVLNVVIPVNTSAVVVLPAKRISSVFESGEAIEGHFQFDISEEEGKVYIETGSGNYSFSVVK